MSTPNPGTTNWVPLWDLNGGIDLRYLGDWVSGSYRDGDVTIYQGTAYVCVRPTTAAPTPWATSVALGYGTTLPASPYNGQEFVLVDSTTNPSYQWRLRFNANSTSAYKWEFVGGAPVNGYVGTTESSAAAGWTDLATIGPSFTLPRAGDYLFAFETTMTCSIANWPHVGLSLSGAAPAIEALASNNAAMYQTASSTWRKIAGLAASTAVKLMYHPNGASVTFLYRTLNVQPVRVA